MSSSRDRMNKPIVSEAVRRCVRWTVRGTVLGRFDGHFDGQRTHQHVNTTLVFRPTKIQCERSSFVLCDITVRLLIVIVTIVMKL